MEGDREIPGSGGVGGSSGNSSSSSGNAASSSSPTTNTTSSNTSSSTSDDNPNPYKPQEKQDQPGTQPISSGVKDNQDGSDQANEKNGFAPPGSSSTTQQKMPQHPDQASAKQAQHLNIPTTGSASPGDGVSASGSSPAVSYDASSLDHLQAQANELSASAGLSSFSAPAPVAAGSGNNSFAQIQQRLKQNQIPPVSSSTNSNNGSMDNAPTTIPPQAGAQAEETTHQTQQETTQAVSQQQATNNPSSSSTNQQPYAFLQPQQPPPIAPAVAAPNLLPQLLLPPGAAGQPMIPMPPPQFAGQFLQPPTAPGVIPNLMLTQQLQALAAQQQQQMNNHPPGLASAGANLKREASEAPTTSAQPESKKRSTTTGAIAPPSSVVSASTIGIGGNSQASSSRTSTTTASSSSMNMPPTMTSSMSMNHHHHLGVGSNDDAVLSKPTEKELANMTPAERRRHERNLREQQRSSKISQQIKELRDVLEQSNVSFKPNKYSILLSVAEYIKQLQARAIMLDSEHQKLILTVQQTNELVSSGAAPSSGTEEATTNTSGSGSDTGSDSDMLFVQGLDYKSLFDQCPAALGIASLDGRILECNSEFQMLLGFPKDELMKQSLFNLVRNHQDVFRAMAQMLKTAEEPLIAVPTKELEKQRHWSGPVISTRDRKVSTNAVARIRAKVVLFEALFQEPDDSKQISHYMSCFYSSRSTLH